MDLRQYLQALRKFWWVIVLSTVLAATFGVVNVSRLDPVYRGSTTFFVRTVGDANTNSQFAGDQFAQRRVNSYVALLSTERMATMIIDKAELDMEPRAVSGMISASGDINTVLLTATVTSSSRELADRVNQAVSTEFVELVNTVENTDVGSAGVNVEVVSGPEVRTVPQKKTEKVSLFVAIGLLVGFGAALLLELSDTAVRSEEQLVSLGAGPILGRIPFEKSFSTAPLVTDLDQFGARAEAFRQLRTNLNFINIGHPVKVISVTSAVPGEGKSSVSANLCISIAASGQRVLAIDADLRRPMMAELFGIEGAVGLTDVLAGNVSVDDVIQRWGRGGPFLLPGGGIPPNPSELLGSDAMLKLLEYLRLQFDMVVLDLPPILPVTDAVVAATQSDGALMVVRYGKTSRQQVAASVEALRVVGAPFLGSVLTRTPSKSSRYSAYSYASYGPESDETVVSRGLRTGRMAASRSSLPLSFLTPTNGQRSRT